jgi:hypothetical protein
MDVRCGSIASVGCVPVTSRLPRTTDIVAVLRHVSNVPIPDVASPGRVNGPTSAAPSKGSKAIVVITKVAAHVILAAPCLSKIQYRNKGIRSLQFDQTNNHEKLRSSPSARLSRRSPKQSSAEPAISFSAFTSPELRHYRAADCVRRRREPYHGGNDQGLFLGCVGSIHGRFQTHNACFSSWISDVLVARVNSMVLSTVDLNVRCWAQTRGGRGTAQGQLSANSRLDVAAMHSP